jgi:hypothetical protein
MVAAIAPIPPNTARSRVASSRQSNSNNDEIPPCGGDRTLAVMHPAKNPDIRQDQTLTNPIRRNTKNRGNAMIVIGAAEYETPMSKHNAK